VAAIATARRSDTPGLLTALSLLLTQEPPEQLQRHGLPPAPYASSTLQLQVQNRGVPSHQPIDSWGAGSDHTYPGFRTPPWPSRRHNSVNRTLTVDDHILGMYLLRSKNMSCPHTKQERPKVWRCSSISIELHKATLNRRKHAILIGQWPSQRSTPRVVVKALDWYT
jgi:hypothetical protein